jgi:hypothetical protein
MNRSILLFCLLFSLNLFATSQVPTNMNTGAEALYGSSHYTFVCGTCHVSAAGGGSRTNFGQTVNTQVSGNSSSISSSSAAQTVINAIGSADSDGDGFTNATEIEMGSNPASATSTPDSPTEDNANSGTTTSSSGCGINPNPDGFQKAFPNFAFLLFLPLFVTIFRRRSIS